MHGSMAYPDHGENRIPRVIGGQEPEESVSQSASQEKWSRGKFRAREEFGVWRSYWGPKPLTTRITVHAPTSTAQSEQKEWTLRKGAKLHEPRSPNGPGEKSFARLRK